MYIYQLVIDNAATCVQCNCLACAPLLTVPSNRSTEPDHSLAV